MKKLALCLLTCFAVMQLHAAEMWMTDFSKAQAQAKAEKKLLLVEFTGSDWCPPCMALKKNVFSSSEFAGFAKANLILVEADFPQHKELSATQTKANEALAKKFNVEGYPTVVVLDANGKQLLRETGYDSSSPKDYIAKLKKLKTK